MISNGEIVRAARLIFRQIKFNMDNFLIAILIFSYMLPSMTKGIAPNAGGGKRGVGFIVIATLGTDIRS